MWGNRVARSTAGALQGALHALQRGLNRDSKNESQFPPASRPRRLAFPPAASHDHRDAHIVAHGNLALRHSHRLRLYFRNSRMKISAELL
jgi:hypothetical protein